MPEFERAPRAARQSTAGAVLTLSSGATASVVTSNAGASGAGSSGGDSGVEPALAGVATDRLRRGAVKRVLLEPVFVIAQRARSSKRLPKVATVGAHEGGKTSR
jgi:hypothetical protein